MDKPKSHIAAKVPARESGTVTLGGEQSSGATGAHLGKVIGPSFSAEEMPDVIAQVIDTFVDNRIEGERFIETFGRIGMAPFKERVYASRQAHA